METFSDQIGLTRRKLLLLAGAAASGSLLSACATSPVTGESILVGMSEDAEIAADRQAAPQQFSQDMGAIQDTAVNQYVIGVGQGLQRVTHRPQMPYNYRVLNANYVNAYTFPGGSMGLTRGIMADLDDEAQLAALLGHELGHVNARHAAQRQGQAMVAQGALAAASVAADLRGGGLAGVAVNVLGQVGASALLSSYSRDNEREADQLGMQYMRQAGYDPKGMVGLMEMLNEGHKEQPGLLETMFSTHPMSSERLLTARNTASAPGAQGKILRERYMDSTASLRRIKPTIVACQKGEVAASKKQFQEAEEHLKSALRQTPRDYPANLIMGKLLVSQKRHQDAQRYLETAKAVYPGEAQALKYAGINEMGMGKPQAALNNLNLAQRALPADTGLHFLKGAAFEQAGDRRNAAANYQAFLRTQSNGSTSQYAAQRLKSWGYAAR